MSEENRFKIMVEVYGWEGRVVETECVQVKEVGP